MRVISYSSDIKSIRENIIIPENDTTKSHVNSSLKKYIINTKTNIFPDKYIYKHVWLPDGYKSTYKKDFIKYT